MSSDRPSELPSSNSVVREFVSLESSTGRRNPVGFAPCQGLYHRPEHESPKIAFIATHYNVDFSEHYLGSYLAKLGYGFLGWNTRFRGNEPWFILEHALVDIAAGMQWLREKADVETIVILGNSGGGSLMGAYQSQATSPNVTPLEGMLLPAGFDKLPAADFYVSLNAHMGRPEVLTDWMDPSVTDEFDPLAIDQSLNMYNPENGPPYSETFVEKYRAAQVVRNNRITQWVLDELQRVKAQGVSERVFTMQRVWADLRLMDATIDPSERPIGVCYAGDAKRANFDARGIGNCSSLRSWLSMWSLEYSQCRGADHLARIDVPSLVLQSLGDCGVFPSDARAIVGALGCADKELTIISGDHYLVEPLQAREMVAQSIHDWLLARVATS